MNTRLHYSMVSVLTRNGIRRVVSAAKLRDIHGAFVGHLYREQWFEEQGDPAEHTGLGEWKGGTTFTLTRERFGTTPDGCNYASEHEAIGALQPETATA